MALVSDLAKLDDVDDEPDLFPTTYPSTICLFCLRNSNLITVARIFSFARKDSLTRHVHNCYLEYIDLSADFESHGDHAGFKKHAALVHNVWHGNQACLRCEPFSRERSSIPIIYYYIMNCLIKLPTFTIHIVRWFRL